MLNPANSRYKLNSDMEPFQEIRIGNTLVDWEGLIDSSYRTTQMMVDKYPAYVRDNKPSKDNNVRARFRVGDSYPYATSKHCNFDESECWTIRTHPKINSISAEEGYITGGQTIKIEGEGLKITNTSSVTIDGVEC